MKHADVCGLDPAVRIVSAWGRIGGGYDEGQVVVVAGDDPWDFALFYALRRLMSRAYWVPSAWANDSNIVLCLSGGMPMPVSATLIAITPSARLRDSLCGFQPEVTGSTRIPPSPLGA